jgi:hypothetical protein
MPRTKVQIESDDGVKLIIKAEDTIAIDVNKEVSK